MPELPEVETIVRQLRPDVVGKKFWSAEVINRSIAFPSAERFESRIRGLRVIGVKRQGKFIVLELSDQMKLVIHLRMTGRLMWRRQKGREKYIMVVFNFSDGTTLFFSDVRKFGRVWLYNNRDYQNATGIFRLGPDPLQEGFSFCEFQRLFLARKGALKANLLRQDLISGVGNIYADEICFNAGIAPEKQTKELKNEDLKRLYRAVKFCLKEGIKHCGVSVSDFVGIRGKPGRHQNYLRVYGRKGEQCSRCDQIIKKIKLAGRGTYYCPGCQK